MYIDIDIDITFTVHMCKVFESIIFLEMIVPSSSHQKSSWLCEAVFCQDRIAKRMVEEAEKTLGRPWQTMGDLGESGCFLRSGRIKPGPGLSLLGGLLLLIIKIFKIIVSIDDYSIYIIYW